MSKRQRLSDDDDVQAQGDFEVQSQVGGMLGANARGMTNVLVTSAADHVAALLADERHSHAQLKLKRKQERCVALQAELLELKAANAELQRDKANLEMECSARVDAIKLDLNESLRLTNEYALGQDQARILESPPSYTEVRTSDGGNIGDWNRWTLQDRTVQLLYEQSQEPGGKNFLLAAFHFLAVQSRSLWLVAPREHVASTILGLCMRILSHITIELQPRWTMVARVSLMLSWRTLDDCLLQAVRDGLQTVQRPCTKLCSNCNATCVTVTSRQEHVWRASRFALVQLYLTEVSFAQYETNLWTMSEDQQFLEETLRWLSDAFQEEKKMLAGVPVQSCQIEVSF